MKSPLQIATEYAEQYKKHGPKGSPALADALWGAIEAGAAVEWPTIDHIAAAFQVSPERIRNAAKFCRDMGFPRQAGERLDLDLVTILEKDRWGEEWVTGGSQEPGPDFDCDKVGEELLDDIDQTEELAAVFRKPGPPRDEIAITKVHGRSEFRRLLAELISRQSWEISADTPDHLLADYLVGCLKVWENLIRRRSLFTEPVTKLGRKDVEEVVTLFQGLSGWYVPLGKFVEDWAIDQSPDIPFRVIVHGIIEAIANLRQTVKDRDEWYGKEGAEE